MRKFYLLLSEWYFEQRLKDSRAYKLLCVHLKDPPKAGNLFPFLREQEDDVPDDSMESDFANFHAITASLTPYRQE